MAGGFGVLFWQKPLYVSVAVFRIFFNSLGDRKRAVGGFFVDHFHRKVASPTHGSAMLRW